MRLIRIGLAVLLGIALTCGYPLKPAGAKTKVPVKKLNDWIDTVREDVEVILEALESPNTPRESKLYLAGGLSYLLRKIDITPDYLGGLGMVDDILVIRLAAGLAAEEGSGELDPYLEDALSRLGQSLGSLEGYLGDLYPGLEAYVKELLQGEVRGCIADKIIDDDETYQQFLWTVEDAILNYTPKPITYERRLVSALFDFIKENGEGDNGDPSESGDSGKRESF